ncbi:hypothetical protein JL720_15117 [Aureococcus anophagefferens]|nr:hypothetical protein JL720_15117 [Aureococcus anophagefferens]
MLVFAVALVAAVRCAAAPRSDALAYEADGVAVWRGVVAADEVAALRGAYDAWAANASFDGAVTVNFCSPWPTLWPGAPACDSGVAPIVEDLLRAAAARADNRGDGGARARLPAHARGRERRDEPAVVAGGGAGARLRAGARGPLRRARGAGARRRERREAVAGVLGPGCRRLCHVGANVLSPASYWLAVTHDDVDVTLFVVPAPQGGDDDDFRVLEAARAAPGKRLEAVALNSLRALEARAVAPYRGTCDAVYVDLWNLGAAAYDRRAETRNGTCVDWARSTVRAPAVDFADCAEATGRNLVGLGGFLWHAVPDGALAAAEAREAAAADAADVPDAEPRGAAAPDAGVALAPGWLAHHAGACDFVLVTCAREGDVARAREALGVIASAVLSAPRGPRRHALRFTVFCNHVAAKVLRRSMQRLMDMAWGRFGGEDLVVYFDATWPDRPEAAKAHLMLFKPCATVKLFLPQILDPTIRWAVYLDTDVVFAADPAALWLGGGHAAAAGAAVAAAAEHGDVAPSCEGSASTTTTRAPRPGPSRAPSRTTARTRASSR